MTESEFLKQIEAHKGILYKVSRIYFEQETDREDLVQEIILQSWKSLPSFQGKSAFSTWLYRIALNTAIVYFKKEKKRKVQTVEQVPEQVDAGDNSQEKESQIQQFYTAVYQLNKIEKALVLYYIEGLSGKEMSRSLGLSEAHVRVKLTRIKQKLKNIIQDQAYEYWRF